MAFLFTCSSSISPAPADSTVPTLIATGNVEGPGTKAKAHKQPVFASPVRFEPAITHARGLRK